ncbi:MAG: quinolinate synthase NadA [Candidatus Omnitrophica bacterium]|jgi:quinolinate synthase|nr:quinolinate synthase NadA [Candidatus Omnitrophota bacterium]MDD3275088.1 quinolinate synthase NadA [Candidatus Omnitrophota bacterium]MDD5077928.1 quinolinate synthase NadA [Candidatus Omnitrophota bacterium]MDD5724960.1 quinolinate synthase NadA [Candidatus Omnitrophota bacterium]
MKMIKEDKKVITRIKELKKKRNAVILAHNYQLPEVQDIADFRGDSLELSRIAAKTECEVIVFCGVYFMAETASILSPDKKVIMPDISAGCPMANMMTADDLRKLKKEHPGAVAVGYVNTSAAVKAELDYCCTSTNAVAVVNALKDKKDIIFVPDKYLADYVSKKSGRKLISWHGFCPTHVKILPEDLIREKKFHPRAKVMSHPECLAAVVSQSELVVSTSQMAKHAREDSTKEFIVGTEAGLIYRLKQDNPTKEFYLASERAVCPNMKRTTQEKVLWALEELKDEVKVSEDIRKKARRAIDRMLSII